MKLFFSPQAQPSEADIAAELAQIQAESIGWTPLEPGAYLHVGDPNATVIEVVGVPHADMKGLTVLLLS
jgi:hypothetical protein